MIGRQLGPYEITDKLGEGGMGEVYRATDSKLRREVAIKVLPAAFTEDPERLARFEREAQLLAQLQHPNIASIYGLEESEGQRALVMELVEGPTLDERMAPGALSIDESLTLARQMAEALSEAHDKGIIHRDLKPQNVKVGTDGRVKVLDFGLAKAMDASEGSTSVAEMAHSPTLLNSPTLTAVPGTQLGVILGTAAYMAPEQAKGFAVDKRADIWAFGVVLFEMLTGTSLFVGDSVADTLARVLQREIDFSALPAATPIEIRRLLRRCLERNPKRRLRDIGDAGIVIDDVATGVDDGEIVAAAGGEAVNGSRRTFLLWLGAMIAIAILAGVAGYESGREVETPAEPQHLSIQLSPEQELGVNNNPLIDFSPDGRTLYFSGREKGRSWIFGRDLDQKEASPIAGTEGGATPFVSPDGRWIGFIASNQVKKVPVEGGRPFEVLDSRGSGGSAWLPDGRLIFGRVYSDGLFVLHPSGGEPERLTTPDREDGVLGHWHPEHLPGTQKILFTAFRTPVDRSRIGVIDLESAEVRWLVEGGFFGRYVDTGHLVFARGQRLFALPFDAATAEVRGPEVAVVDDVRTSPTGGLAMFAISSRGTLAYVSEALGNPAKELVWLDRQGKSSPLAIDRQRFDSVSLSPDGKQAALTIQQKSMDLWIYSLERGTLSRLTSGDRSEFDPQWSVDGREIFYVVDSPPFELHRITVGSPDTGRVIFDEPARLDTTFVAVSPDGRHIAFNRTDAETGRNILHRLLDGSGEPLEVRGSRSEEAMASFSPDGRFLVYQSDETGRNEIYVEALDGSQKRFQISADGGTEPLWAKNGEIFYRHGDDLNVLSTRSDPAFEFAEPERLFSYPIPHGFQERVRTFDVTADGQRILAIGIPEVSRPRRIEIVTDWTSRLERLVPRAE